MTWLEVLIAVPPEGIDAVCAKLIALGVEGMQIADHGELLCFMEENRSAWDYVDEALLSGEREASTVKVYLPSNVQGADDLAALRSGLEELKEGPFAVSGLDVAVRAVDDSDWEIAWKQFYKSTEIGNRLLIRPAWEPETPTDRVVFINDPGMSFGTGTHASTSLCLEALENAVRGGETLLDLGCGSGILSICALLLGAASAVAVDIHAAAVETAMENATRNGVAERYRILAGNVLAESDGVLGALGERKFDIITANIVADTILALVPAVRGLLDPGGLFLASGIIDDRAEEVLWGLEEGGFVLRECREQEGWTAFLVSRE